MQHVLWLSECLNVPTLVQAVVSIPAFRQTVTTTYYTHEDTHTGEREGEKQNNRISSLATVEIININVL